MVKEYLDIVGFFKKKRFIFYILACVCLYICVYHVSMLWRPEDNVVFS